MRYEEVRQLIKAELKKQSQGLTWADLKVRLNLPYKTLCPEWTSQLEDEIGLVRNKTGGRAYVWTINQKGGRDA